MVADLPDAVSIDRSGDLSLGDVLDGLGEVDILQIDGGDLANEWELLL